MKVNLEYVEESPLSESCLKYKGKHIEIAITLSGFLKRHEIEKFTVSDEPMPDSYFLWRVRSEWYADASGYDNIMVCNVWLKRLFKKLPKYLYVKKIESPSPSCSACTAWR